MPTSNAKSNGYHLKEAPKNDYLDYEDDEELEGACALPLKKEGPQLPDKNIEDILQLETSKVMEIFPHFGVGYIRRLLSFYNNSAETVISKILEGVLLGRKKLFKNSFYFFHFSENLDETLKNCDENEPYIPPESPLKSFEPAAPSTSNEDEINKKTSFLDTFKGDILQKGKNLTTKAPKTYNELFNDKSQINQMRDRYKQYSMVGGNEEEEANDREYDDEYDDSYEVFADTERKIHLHGKMREALPDDIDSSEESESEPEEETENSRPRKNPLDFCENPEEIRRRREQNYQQRMAKKFPHRPAPSTRDVTGNVKGQGQTNEVLRNRQFKNTNKSSRANHNRKSGSTFKQSRGMF
jgi:activating signal cointegrator complex subunit 2